MLGSFWSGLGGKLADQWPAALLTPAFAFWGGGLLAAGFYFGWDTLTKRFDTLPPTLQVAVLVGALLLVLASGAAMQRVTFSVLRLLEGYWPKWWAPARAWGIARYTRHHLRLEARFQVLQALQTRPANEWPLSEQEKAILANQNQEEQEAPGWIERVSVFVFEGPLSSTNAGSNAGPPQDARSKALRKAFAEALRRRRQAVVCDDVEGYKMRVASELGECEAQVRLLPANPADLMPTRLGNILRASERRIAAYHGLDPVVCWPRLWLVLAEGDKSDLAQARAALDQAVQVGVWATLFFVWWIWAWWAPLVALGVLLFVHFQLLAAAAIAYSALVEATFDMRQGDLYRALGWTPPSTAHEQVIYGRAVTTLLVRGPAPADGR